MILALLRVRKLPGFGMPSELSSAVIEVKERYVTVRTRDISFLQFILEGYDGLASVTTIDPEKALLRISIMPDFADDVEAVLNALSDEIHVRPYRPEIIINSETGK